MSNVRLEHALLDVRDLNRSLAFYQKLIPDWTVRWEGPAESGRWIHFGPPDPEGQPGYLSLYEIPDAGPAGDDGGVRIEHVGFSHPNVHGLVKRLEADGVRATDLVDDGRYRRAYYDDPDGHQLEFVERLR